MGAQNQVNGESEVAGQSEDASNALPIKPREWRVDMQRRRRSSTDTLVVWGFVLSFLGLFGLGCFEACKIFAVIPAAFESSSGIWSNPTTASYDDGPPPPRGGRTLSPRERAHQPGPGDR